MTTEEWREIPDSDYSVSSEGRVASRKLNRWLVLCPIRMPSGYLTINLYCPKIKQHRIHILVANAFLGPKPTTKHQVNHKNGIKSDNRASNLEWVTGSENLHHAYDVLGVKSVRGESHGRSKLTEKEAREILAGVARGETHLALATRYHVGRQHIGRIAMGGNWGWMKQEQHERTT